MTLDQAVRWVRPVRAPRPSTAAWVLAGAVVAWAVLAVGSVAGTRAGDAATGHVHQHSGLAAVDPWTAAWVLGWLLMVAAMMWPLAVPTLSAVGRAAFRGWRVRLVATCAWARSPCSGSPSASGCSRGSYPVADPGAGVRPPVGADRSPSVPRVDRAAPSRPRWMP